MHPLPTTIATFETKLMTVTQRDQFEKPGKNKQMQILLLEHKARQFTTDGFKRVIQLCERRKRRSSDGKLWMQPEPA